MCSRKSLIYSVSFCKSFFPWIDSKKALHAIETSDLLIFTINLYGNLNTLILEDQSKFILPHDDSILLRRRDIFFLYNCKIWNMLNLQNSKHTLNQFSESQNNDKKLMQIRRKLDQAVKYMWVKKLLLDNSEISIFVFSKHLLCFNVTF